MVHGGEMVPTGGNGWERWRGEIDARLDDSEESLRALWRFKEEAERKIVAMETKIVFFAAIAAALGAMLPGALAAVLKHL